jgi:hypothetical protein
VVADDKGYHSGAVLEQIKKKGVRTYIPEKKQAGKRPWKGKEKEQRAVYQNRQRVRGDYGKRLHLLHNLSEALIDSLVPHHRLLVEVAKATSTQSEATAVSITHESDAAESRSRRQDIRQQKNRERRLACYEAVMEQVRQGVTQVEIAHRFGLG